MRERRLANAWGKCVDVYLSRGIFFLLLSPDLLIGHDRRDREKEGARVDWLAGSKVVG